jgi:predicted AAA+ superfamily ATPase
MDLFWENKGWEHEDVHLQRLHRKAFVHPFPEVRLGMGLHMIRGPRQVGKTTWLKILLAQHSREKPTDCFYLSCENVRDHLDLAEVLKSVRKRKLLFLDEITFVKDWARAIKHEIDRGSLATTVLTGSNAADLRRGGERLPGRRGQGIDLLLLPMNFDEFCRARRQAGWALPSRLDELKQYFRIGGFPAAVQEAGGENRMPIEAHQTYQQWLAGDFTKFGKQEMHLREILLQIALTMSTPLSLQTLASRTQLGSHHTAQSYVELLEDCFGLRTLYAVDPNTGAFRFKKDKKFYFTDPLIYWMSLNWAGHPVPPEAEAVLAELTAHETLSRRHKRLGYFHSPKGEVDFYVRNEWAIEVKWSPVVRNVSPAFKTLRVPKKTVWSQENFLEDDLRLAGAPAIP